MLFLSIDLGYGVGSRIDHRQIKAADPRSPALAPKGRANGGWLLIFLGLLTLSFLGGYLFFISKICQSQRLTFALGVVAVCLVFGFNFYFFSFEYAGSAPAGAVSLRPGRPQAARRQAPSPCGLVDHRQTFKPEQFYVVLRTCV